MNHPDPSTRKWLTSAQPRAPRTWPWKAATVTALAVAAAMLGIYLAEHEDDVGVPTVEIERELGLSLDGSTETVRDPRTGELIEVDIRVLDTDCARTADVRAACIVSAEVQDESRSYGYIVEIDRSSGEFLWHEP